jgi:hypothetical protein
MIEMIMTLLILSGPSQGHTYDIRVRFQPIGIELPWEVRHRCDIHASEALLPRFALTLNEELKGEDPKIDTVVPVKARCVKTEAL